jgi:hypothetical protein
MFMLEDQRLSGADPKTLAETQAASHITRSAVEAPLVTVRILVPTLARPAKDATRTTYAMRNAADQAALEAFRQDALNASDRLVEAASAFFADRGVAA